MLKKPYTQVIVGIIVIGIVGALFILGLGVSISSKDVNSTNILNRSAPSAVQGANAPAAASTPLNSPTTTVLPTPTATSQPSLLTLVTPTEAVGQVINHPASRSGQMTLRRTDKLPRRSYNEILSQIKGDWAKGGTYQGKPVTVTVTFGLATFGYLSPDGKSWIGDRNIRLYTCSANDNCTDTGQVLDHIEDRPMWILDYKNIPLCGSATCTNHAVFAIDDETGVKLIAWGYDAS